MGNKYPAWSIVLAARYKNGVIYIFSAYTTNSPHIYLPMMFPASTDFKNVCLLVEIPKKVAAGTIKNIFGVPYLQTYEN